MTIKNHDFNPESLTDLTATVSMDCATVALPDDFVSDPAVLSQIILSFWGHILYMRNQIPLPLANIVGAGLQNFVSSADTQIKSRDQTIKKLLKFDTVYQSLSSSIHSMLRSLGDQCRLHSLKAVYIMIGPSSSCSREAHVLHFNIPRHDGFPDGEKQKITELQLETCKRQLIRTMISNWSPDPKTSPLTNSFIVLQLRGSTSTENGGSLLGSDFSEFSLKEGYKIRVRKKSPPSFNLQVNSLVSPDVEFSDSAECDDSSAPEFWVVLRKGVKAVKSIG